MEPTYTPESSNNKESVSSEYTASPMVNGINNWYDIDVSSSSVFQNTVGLSFSFISFVIKVMVIGVNSDIIILNIGVAKVV